MSSHRKEHTLSDSLRNTAATLHLDIDALERGEMVQTEIVIPTPQEMKRLLAVPHRPETFDHVSKALAFAGESPSSYDAGVKHFSAYVVGLTELDTDIGSGFFKKRFPMKVRVLAAGKYTVDKDIYVEPGSQPYYLACDNLVFDGGSITVKNTNFVLWACTDLTIVSGSKSNPYHIGIFGAPGGTGPAGPDMPDQPQAPNGREAPVPSPGVCTGAGSGGPGTKGKDGYDGGPGIPGNDGLASLGAIINIASFVSPQAPLAIYGKSGIGGDGGRGGNGGRGQQGGNGGNGCKSGCEGTDGGNGADGGKGGHGGNGGTGGNAVNGGVINLNINSSQNGPNFYMYTPLQAAPGNGGAAGAAGLPGDGGAGGKGGHNSTDGTRGNSGAMGEPGAKGPAGSTYGTPPQLVVGKYVPPTSMKLNVRGAA